MNDFKLLLKSSLFMVGLLCIFLSVLFPILHIMWDIYIEADSTILFLSGLGLVFISFIIPSDALVSGDEQ